jgi:hypothetical protein
MNTEFAVLIAIDLNIERSRPNRAIRPMVNPNIMNHCFEVLSDPADRYAIQNLDALVVSNSYPLQDIYECLSIACSPKFGNQKS